jgi:hypothetical protein
VHVRAAIRGGDWSDGSRIKRCADAAGNLLNGLYHGKVFAVNPSATKFSGCIASKTSAAFREKSTWKSFRRDFDTRADKKGGSA